jgi:predicted MPP superfamily phosphohydrolase
MHGLGGGIVMKIRVFSDLHLEFDDFEYYRLDEDVIVLAGDIHNKNQLHQFLAKLPTDIPIIFVPGNHEYFRNDYDIVNNYFIRLAGHIPNFHVLLNTNITVNGVEFFGGAMFTDFQLYGCQNEWFCHNKIKRWPDCGHLRTIRTNTKTSNRNLNTG